MKPWSTTKYYTKTQLRINLDQTTNSTWGSVTAIHSLLYLIGWFQWKTLTSYSVTPFIERGLETKRPLFGCLRLFKMSRVHAIIACPRDMYPQGVALSEFFVPHDFTPMFCRCSMSRQSSFGWTSCGMLQQRMLQKKRFLLCEQFVSVFAALLQI